MFKFKRLKHKCKSFPELYDICNQQNFFEMAEINLLNAANGLFDGLFGGRREYYKTPTPTQQSIILSGEADFLNPDTWKPHNIFSTTPQLFAVINRRGYLLASGVWRHYKSKPGGGVVEIENSPFVKLLENPNPLVNGNDHVRQWNENKCVFGNNYEYILKAFERDELPAALTNLIPTTVGIKTSGLYYKQTRLEDIIKYYEVRDGVDVIDKLTPAEVNHTKTVNAMNPVKGESPMTSLHMPISNIRAAYQFRNVIMTKKGALGLLTSNNKDASGAIPLSPQERKRIEDEFKRSYGIGKDQMQTILTSASLKYEAMAYPTKDLMLFEEVDADFRTIIDGYGLNDMLFSREKGATFSNLAEGMVHAYQATIIPEAEELAMNRSRLFKLLEKGEFMELDYGHIPVLQENKKEKAEILEKKANAIAKLNEMGGIYSAADLRKIMED